MYRMFKWLAPVMAFGVVAAFTHIAAKADDAPAATQPATATITVTVVDEGGTAQAGVMVEILPAAAAAHGKHNKGATTSDSPADNGGNGQAPAPKKGHGAAAAAVATGTSDANGTIVLTVPAGDYRIIAHVKGAGHGMATKTVNAGDTTTVTVTLHPPKAKKPTTNPAQ